MARVIPAALEDPPQTGTVDSDQESPTAASGAGPFTSEYKVEVLAEYASWPLGSAMRSAILRREGLALSHIREWLGHHDVEEPSPRSRRRSRSEWMEQDRLRKRNAAEAAEAARERAALYVKNGRALFELMEVLNDAFPDERS